MRHIRIRDVSISSIIFMRVLRVLRVFQFNSLRTAESHEYPFSFSSLSEFNAILRC